MYADSYTNGVILETLTPVEQRLYMRAVRLRAVRVSDMEDLCANDQTLRSALVRLTKKGYIIRVRRGLYAAVPLEQVGSGYDPDRYLLAFRAAWPDGVLSYHTALELHGVAHSLFNRVHSFVPREMRGFQHKGVEYVFHSTSRMFGAVPMLRDGVEIRATDREQTFLDCVRRPDICGGLEEVLRSLSGFHTVDMQNIEGYLKEYGERGLVHRAGFVLSFLSDELRISDDRLESLRARIGPRAYYLEPKPQKKRGRLVKGWNVIVPKDLEEVKRFV